LIECLCDACELAISSAHFEQFYCHCDDCRAISVGSYTSKSLHSLDTVKVERGPTTTWVYKSKTRTFCANCETLLVGEVSDLDLSGMNASRFSQLTHASFSPAMQFSEVPIADALPQYAGLSAIWGGSYEKINWRSR
jgi:hypothetical protein